VVVGSLALCLALLMMMGEKSDTAPVPAPSLQPGCTYTIVYKGDTKWRELGAGEGELGVRFEAVASGSGTGAARPVSSLPLLRLLRHFFTGILQLRPGLAHEGVLWYTAWQFLLKQILQRSLKVTSYTTVGADRYLSYDLSQPWWQGSPLHQGVLVLSIGFIALSTATVALEAWHSKFWQAQMQTQRVDTDGESGEAILDPSNDYKPKMVPLTANQRLKMRLEVIGNLAKYGSAWSILWGPYEHLSSCVHLIVFSTLETMAVLYLQFFSPDGLPVQGQGLLLEEAQQYHLGEMRNFVGAIWVTAATIMLGLACALSEPIRKNDSVGWVFLVLNAAFFTWCLGWACQKVLWGHQQQGKEVEGQSPSKEGGSAEHTLDTGLELRMPTTPSEVAPVGEEEEEVVVPQGGKAGVASAELAQSMTLGLQGGADTVLHTPHTSTPVPAEPGSLNSAAEVAEGLGVEVGEDYEGIYK
jgi:hypothetical protein